MKFAVFQNPTVFEVLKTLFEAQLPVKIAYRLSKIQKTIGLEVQKYQELRRGVIMKYAELDSEGQPKVDEADNAKIKPDMIEELVAELNELHDIDFDIGGSVTLDEIEKLSLSTNELSILEDLGVLKFPAETE